MDSRLLNWLRRLVWWRRRTKALPTAELPVLASTEPPSVLVEPPPVSVPKPESSDEQRRREIAEYLFGRVAEILEEPHWSEVVQRVNSLQVPGFSATNMKHLSWLNACGVDITWTLSCITSSSKSRVFLGHADAGCPSLPPDLAELFKVRFQEAWPDRVPYWGPFRPTPSAEEVIQTYEERRKTLGC